jgi:hypothetical protein
MSMRIRGVGVQATLALQTFSDVLCIPHIFYSTSRPTPPTEHSSHTCIMESYHGHWLHEMFT